MTKETDQMRARLSELKREADDLTARRERLHTLRRDGATAADTEAAAKALIAGKATALIDPDTEIVKLDAALKINAAARDLLAESLGRAELREGFKVAGPLFQRAAAHVPKLTELLEAVAEELRAVQGDLRAFDDANGPVAALQARFPHEIAPYADWQLAPLRFGWTEDFLGDGFNPSKLERWLAEVREVGLG